MPILTRTVQLALILYKNYLKLMNSLLAIQWGTITINNLNYKEQKTSRIFIMVQRILWTSMDVVWRGIELVMEQLTYIRINSFK